MSTQAPEKVESAPELPPHAPRVRLTVHAAGGATVCETDAPVTLIGGRRDCALSLPHPDVSKVHCAVINTGRALLIRDLLSRSGTFVNEQVVRAAWLRPGDVLRVGPTPIDVEFLEPSEYPSGGLPEPDPTRLAAPVTVQFGGELVEITLNGAIIGRRQGSEVLIDNPDVSLAHALVLGVEGRPAICDLGSRSGTLLNGQRVELGWLADGDQLEVGGELLTVRYQAPAPTPALAAETHAAIGQSDVTRESASTGESAQPLLLSPMAIGDLADLERTISTVQAHIAGARGRLDERQRELDARAADIERLAAALEARHGTLAQTEAELSQRESAVRTAEEDARVAMGEVEQRRAAVEALTRQLDEQRQHLEAEKVALVADRDQQQAARTALEQQQQALRNAQALCDEKEQQLRQRETQGAAHDAQLADEHARLDAERSSLEQQRTAQAEAATALERREAELGAREAAVAAREHELAKGEAALRERRSREHDALQRIDQFRTALERASALFNTPGGSGTPPTGPGDPGHAPVGNPPMHTPPSPQAAAPPDAASGSLPAPVVERPLFSANQAAPPKDWPPELRERFHVLRRMTNKSNTELLAQVWAERGKLAHPRPQPAPPRTKKRRLPWGN